MTKTINEFREALGQQESSGDYKNIKNKKGFMGKYQMGEAVLADLGYYKDSHIDYNICDWSGTFTGKDGIYSKEDFFKNESVQEKTNKKQQIRKIIVKL